MLYWSKVKSSPRRPCLLSRAFLFLLAGKKEQIKDIVDGSVEGNTLLARIRPSVRSSALRGQFRGASEHPLAGQNLASVHAIPTNTGRSLRNDGELLVMTLTPWGEKHWGM